jgi:hypothetical protein
MTAGRFGPEALIDLAGNVLLDEPYLVRVVGTTTLATLYTDSTGTTTVSQVPPPRTDAAQGYYAGWTAEPFVDIYVPSTGRTIPSVVVGGPSASGIPLSQKGAASGVASLDSAGKLVQVPGANAITDGMVSSISQGKVTGLVAALGGLIPLSQKGTASGVATLGTDGKVPGTQLPASTGGGGGGGGAGGTAAATTYDPSASGLSATNVQAAIDEIKAGIQAAHDQAVMDARAGMVVAAP